MGLYQLRVVRQVLEQLAQAGRRPSQVELRRPRRVLVVWPVSSAVPEGVPERAVLLPLQVVHQVLGQPETVVRQPLQAVRPHRPMALVERPA